MPPQQPDTSCCAVILSGGLNSRMGGRNKAFLEIGPETILDRLERTLRPVFAEIVLVTRQPELYSGRDLRVVHDLYGARSSLTGIHAGLKQSTTPYIFVVPCDTPFLQPGLVRLLLSEIEAGVEVIVPRYDDRYEPLCAIYSRSCLPFIEEQLDRNDFRIFNFFSKVSVKEIPQDRLRAVDPELRSFFNVNTPEALSRSRELS